MAEYVVSNEEVSFAYRELSAIPLMHSFIDVKKVKKVDLTETNISNYENLGQFINAEVLILDKNEVLTHLLTHPPTHQVTNSLRLL